MPCTGLTSPRQHLAVGSLDGIPKVGEQAVDAPIRAKSGRCNIFGQVGGIHPAGAAARFLHLHPQVLVDDWMKARFA